MDIFFTDPSEVPLPPDQVRIRLLKAEPYPDGRRVRVYLETDPFQRQPSADLVLSDDQGRELAEASIIEPMHRKIELVMHLRGAPRVENCSLKAELYYASLNDPDSGQEPALAERRVVDSARFDFVINQNQEDKH
jgi:hypothetical protein